MQPFTLNQAAKACNKSKSTLLNAIRSGRLSAGRDDKNQWQIQASELFRVYPPTEHLPPERNRDKPHAQNHQNSELLTQMLENEQQERERERQQLQETINDLRRRLDNEALDNEAQERRKLTALLTHQPQQPEASLLWRKLFWRH